MGCCGPSGWAEAGGRAPALDAGPQPWRPDSPLLSPPTPSLPTSGASARLLRDIVVNTIITAAAGTSSKPLSDLFNMWPY